MEEPFVDVRSQSRAGRGAHTLTRRATFGAMTALGLASALGGDGAEGKKKKRRKKKGLAPPRVQFVRTWGSFGAANGQFDDPKGIAVAPNGDVYVADDRNDRIQFFDAAGVFLGQFEIGGGSGRPLDVEVAANRDVFVTNRASGSKIERFSAGGEFLGSIGSEGNGDGQFVNLFCLALAANGDVYSGDTAFSRIQQFGPAGNFIRKWGVAGAADSEFAGLEALAASPSGDVYAVDSGNFRVQRFSATGDFLGKWGGQGSGDGQFEEPSGITVAPNGDVFVADAVLNRVQIFDRSGKFLGQFGTPGADDGQFSEPAGVALGPNQTVYVVDGGNNRIQQFVLLKPKKKKNKKR